MENKTTPTNWISRGGGNGMGEIKESWWPQWV